ncbi:hypothetical protein HMPREF9130_0224 [Peptoniphilus sp. oral taxon 375 str. F0436]|nr:hypothetical protein HMPREF9130_0224 [Peptoniphilus sp. oral taxon 375 str. F0436]
MTKGSFSVKYKLLHFFMALLRKIKLIFIFLLGFLRKI